MKRRAVFQLMVGALAALSGVGRGAQATTKVQRRSLLIQESPVAGFQYHEGERLWPRLRERQSVKLVREPANRHDPRAVRIDWRGHRLGYLPRVENAAVSQMLDRGERLSARIVGLAESDDPWRRVRVAVWWSGEVRE